MKDTVITVRGKDYVIRQWAYELWSTDGEYYKPSNSAEDMIAYVQKLAEDFPTMDLLLIRDGQPSIEGHQEILRALGK